VTRDDASGDPATLVELVLDALEQVATSTSWSAR
jgi:hypothetical protein